MSEITEQDAREAAIDIVDGHYGESNEDLDQWHDDIRTCSRWIVQELSRRAAERAEREKPIDAEWLESIDAMKSGQWYIFDLGVQIGLRARMHGWIITVNHRLLDIEYSTRGQLLDLLRALKGGCVNP